MFDAHCRTCGTAVLLTTRRIISLHHTSQGALVYFRCWCGTPGVLVAARPARPRPGVATGRSAALGRPDVHAYGAGG